MSQNLSSAAVVIGALRVKHLAQIFIFCTFHAVDSTLCPPGTCFILFWRLLIFFSKSTFSKHSFRNTIWVSNRLVPDQAQHFVGPDLGPICLQKLSADDIRRQSVEHNVSSFHLLNALWNCHVFDMARDMARASRSDHVLTLHFDRNGLKEKPRETSVRRQQSLVIALLKTTWWSCFTATQVCCIRALVLAAV